MELRTYAWLKNAQEKWDCMKILDHYLMYATIWILSRCALNMKEKTCVKSVTWIKMWRNEMCKNISIMNTKGVENHVWRIRMWSKEGLPKPVIFYPRILVFVPSRDNLETQRGLVDWLRRSRGGIRNKFVAIIYFSKGRVDWMTGVYGG